MPTKLYDDIIFGPVRSRRLGLSLGVNLLPLECKLCSFNCIYCECGWTEKGHKAAFNKREDVARLLADKLFEMVNADNAPDVITFAGNGEPTMHPPIRGDNRRRSEDKGQLRSLGQSFGSDERYDAEKRRASAAPCQKWTTTS